MDNYKGTPGSPLAQMFRCTLREDDKDSAMYTIICCEKRVVLQELTSLVMGMVATLPRFRSILISHKSQYKWFPVDFNISNHIHVTQIKNDGNSTEASDLIMEFANYAMTAPFDLNRPMWDIFLLQNTSKHGGDSIIFRNHRSLGDGVSMASLLVEVLETENGDLPLLPKKRGVVGSTSCLGSIGHALQLLWSCFFCIWGLLRLLVSSNLFGDFKSANSPRHCSQEVTSLKLNIPELKAMATVCNATVNDVFLTLVAATMQKLLRDEAARQEISLEPRPTIAFEDMGQPHAFMAVNLRAPLTPYEIQKMRNGEDCPKWGNVSGFMLVKLAVNHMINPLSRLAIVKATMDRKKRSSEAFLSYIGMSIVGTLFGSRALRRFLNHVTSQATVAVSNFAGPSEQVYLLKNRVLSIHTFSTGLSNAIDFHLVGYMESAQLCICSNVAIVDPELVREHFKTSVDDLRLSTGAVKPKKTSD